MTLADLSSLGSFVSGISVLVTLIFLLIQLRQTNVNQRSMVQQGRAAMQVDAIIRHAEPQFIEIASRASDPEAPLKSWEAYAQMLISMSYLRAMENSFIQQHAGTIDPMSMESDLASLRQFMTLRVNRVSWTLLSEAFSGPFRDHVDALVRDTKTEHVRDFAVIWKSVLAREVDQERR